MIRDKNKLTQVRDVHDALSLIGGKWRCAIVLSLSDGDKRFSELKRSLGNVTSRVLNNDLMFLEMNKIIAKRGAITKPKYCLTAHGKGLQPLILKIVDWAQMHRSVVFQRLDTTYKPVIKPTEITQRIFELQPQLGQRSDAA